MKKLIECVPNFSEGNDMHIIGQITDAMKTVEGISVIDVDPGKATNRTVVTMVGEPEPICEAAFRAVKKAAELIDMTKHKGAHPRFGATDVCPLVPVSNITMEETVEYARALAKRIGEELNIPVYCYENAAFTPERKNLATCRAGEYEALGERLSSEQWHPDFGPEERHPTAGTVAIGARMPLVAYNINLNTPSLEIAHDIAKKIRFIGGGLRFCKAMGVELKDRGITQVSINLTDYSKTALYRAFEMVRFEARRYGVSIIGSEIVGLVPMEALIDTASYYLGLENFSMQQVLEAQIME